MTELYISCHNNYLLIGLSCIIDEVAVKLYDYITIFNSQQCATVKQNNYRYREI